MTRKHFIWLVVCAANGYPMWCFSSENKAWAKINRIVDTNKQIKSGELEVRKIEVN